MSQVRVMILSNNFRRENHLFMLNEYNLHLVKEAIEQNKYLVSPPIETKFEGKLAAEEMFDLTNNPSRQTERLDRYGNGQSLSVGDIVEVDNVKFVCMSFDWKEI